VPNLAQGICKSIDQLVVMERGRSNAEPLGAFYFESGRLRAGQAVNLERALVWGDRLSGHFVLGHVDGVSRLIAVEASGNSWTYRFSIPAGLARFLPEKGSVAIDGISLTVAARRRASFDIAIIPETRRRTSLARARPGDRWNLEVDLFARYGRAGWRRRVETPLRRPTR